MKMYLTVETRQEPTSICSMVVDVKDQKQANMICSHWESRGYVVTWIVIGE